jgi:hypothetical protein
LRSVLVGEVNPLGYVHSVEFRTVCSRPHPGLRPGGWLGSAGQLQSALRAETPDLADMIRWRPSPVLGA